MSKIDVSIIIVNYNTSNLIVECIKSILLHTNLINYEIIVVDNNSTSDQISILKKLTSYFKLIILNENIGFGRANNKGLEISEGEFVLFLNPDTLLQNNAIKILVDFLRLNPNCGACGGNLLTSDLLPTHSYNIRFPGVIDEFDQAVKRKLSLFLNNNTMFNHTNTPLQVAFITGADLMVRKKILDSIGGFNPMFFMYFEDTELQYRIRNYGYEIWNVPSASIVHLEGQSFKVSREREKRILISRRLYYEITHNKGWQKFMDSYYFTLTWFGYCIATIFKMKGMREKLLQRLSILKEIRK